ncbi:MAG: PorT family protein [Dysgonamonadaceae bacterium]|jgi:hypothetical protein|nr:PorT family protein [Dysgonamonadaceae bacterium]
MKKSLILLVILSLFTAITAQAQFKWGLKAGLNISKASFDEKVIATENLTGFQVGPMIELTVPAINIGFDAAVLYSQQGTKIKIEETLLDESYKTNTLEVPVNLKYKISLLDLVGAYVAVGPYASFKLSDDIKKQAEAKSFGAGLNFGLGVELLSHLQVGFNYKLGLTDDYSQKFQISDALGAMKEYENGGKTSQYTISAAYFF